MMTFNFVVVFGLARKIIHIKMLKNHNKSIFKLYIYFYISNDMYSTGCTSTLQCVTNVSYIRKFSICACICGKQIYKESSSRNFLHRTMSQREK